MKQELLREAREMLPNLEVLERRINELTASPKDQQQYRVTARAAVVLARWLYNKLCAAAFDAPAARKEPPAEAVDREWKLPCEVRLPNGMTIGRGVHLHTLLMALQRREVYAGEGAEELLRFNSQQEAERDANARRYKWLLEQTGCFHDGSETTVTLLSDDATRTRSIKVGERYYGIDARSFNAVIDAALADQRPLNPSSGCAGGSSV